MVSALSSTEQGGIALLHLLCLGFCLLLIITYLLPLCPQWWSAYACFLVLPLFYYRGISSTPELLEPVLRPRTALYCELR